jgi:isoleucyl-tRNA synthetase
VPVTGVRRLFFLAPQPRTEAKVKVRQPLARALVTVDPRLRHAVEPLLDLVAGELNVKQVAIAEGEAGLVAFRLVPNFRALGPRFGRQAQAVAAAVRDTDAAALAPRLGAGERVTVEVAGVGPVELGPDEVGVVEEPVTGWRVVREGPVSVALDLEVTPELRGEGLARELVRAVQDLRKAADLAVDDRIELAVKARRRRGRGAPRLPARRDAGHRPAPRPAGGRPRRAGGGGRTGGAALAAAGAARLAAGERPTGRRRG